MDGYLLIVDDNRDYREVLAGLFELKGYTVRQAENGVVALQVLAAHGRPISLLLDLAMPVMTGWDFLAALRAHPDAAIAATHVIVVSGHSDVSGQRSTATELGCLVLAKPVKSEQLLALVDVQARSGT